MKPSHSCLTLYVGDWWYQNWTVYVQKHSVQLQPTPARIKKSLWWQFFEIPPRCYTVPVPAQSGVWKRGGDSPFQRNIMIDREQCQKWKHNWINYTVTRGHRSVIVQFRSWCNNSHDVIKIRHEYPRGTLVPILKSQNVIILGLGLAYIILINRYSHRKACFKP